MADKLQVLILCTANSARSQMGEGLLRHLAGDGAEVYSAGAKPSQVNPYAIRAMDARGIDIRGQNSDHIDQYLSQPFDYVITVCDKAAESCPIFPRRGNTDSLQFPRSRRGRRRRQRGAGLLRRRARRAGGEVS